MKLKHLGAVLIFCISTLCGLNCSLIKVAAASFDLSPATGVVSSTCTNIVNVFIDTDNARSNAADIEIIFNPKEIYVLDSDPATAGTQVTVGKAYDAYIYNEVNNTTGTIRVAAVSMMNILKGKQIFITISFQAKPIATSTSFKIYFTGANSTLDSNIADNETSTDLLTSVTNASFKVGSGSCLSQDPSQQNTLTDNSIPSKSGSEEALTHSNNQCEGPIATLYSINSLIPSIGLFTTISIILNIQTGYYLIIIRPHKANKSRHFSTINRLLKEENLSISTIAYIASLIGLGINPCLLTVSIIIVNTIIFLATLVLKIIQSKRNIS